MPVPSARLARHQSRIRQWATPVGSVMLGALLPAMLPMVAQSPIIPSLGFILFLAWRFVRPELWPLWAGLPLGAIDDLANSRPLGTSMLLWTMTLLALDRVSTRFVWQEYLEDWFMAALALILVTTMGWLFLDMGPGAGGPLLALAPQVGLGILLFPAGVRLAAWLDRWRLP